MNEQKMLDYAQHTSSAMKRAREELGQIEEIKLFIKDMDKLTNFYMKQMEKTIQHHLGVSDNTSIQ